MNIDSNPFSKNKLALKGAIYAVICFAALPVTSLLRAETIYRTADPQGRVTYTDRLPATIDKATALDNENRPPAATVSALPFGLQQISNRYPVTLYSSSNCAPCDSGRSLLGKRGIPFIEKTVNSAADIEALSRISGGNSLPFLTIGGQHIKGFSDSEWTQFLNAADYPLTSILPSSYRQPEASPLVTPQKLQPVAKPAEAPASTYAIEPVQAPTNGISNPAGIRF